MENPTKAPPRNVSAPKARRLFSSLPLVLRALNAIDGLRLAVILGLVCIAGRVDAETLSPLRTVRENRLTSPRDPDVSIELPTPVQYVGAERWILREIADCEVHVFVEADAAKNVIRLYVLQFDGADGASHQIGAADMESLGVQVVSNVRRSFEARVGTDGVEILIDGKSIINAPIPAGALKPGAYELLWNAFGYNTPKDNNPYFFIHWDNFGFDGPNLQRREVHNYVTRIAGTDYQKSSRATASYPTFTVGIPDDLRR